MRARPWLLGLLVGLGGCDFDGALEAFCDGNALCLDGGAQGGADGGGGGGGGGGSAGPEPITALEMLFGDADLQYGGHRSLLQFTASLSDGGPADASTPVFFDGGLVVLLGGDGGAVTQGPLGSTYLFGAPLEDLGAGRRAFTPGPQPFAATVVGSLGPVVATASRTIRARTRFSGYSLSAPFTCVPLEVELLGETNAHFARAPGAALVVEQVSGRPAAVFGAPECAGAPVSLPSSQGAPLPSQATVLSVRLPETVSFRAFVPDAAFIEPSPSHGITAMPLYAALEYGGQSFDGGSPVQRDGGLTIFEQPCTAFQVSWRHVTQAPGALVVSFVPGDRFPFVVESAGLTLYEHPSCGTGAAMGSALSLWSDGGAAQVTLSATTMTGPRTLDVSFPDGGSRTRFDLSTP